MSNTFTAKDGRTLKTVAVSPYSIMQAMPGWPIIIGNELDEYAEACRQHAIDMLQAELMMAPDTIIDEETGREMPSELVYEVKFGASSGSMRPTPAGRVLVALAEAHLTNAKQQLRLFGLAESELRALLTRLQNHEGDADRDAVAGFASQAERRQAQMRAALKRALYHSVIGTTLAGEIVTRSGGVLEPMGKEYLEVKDAPAVTPPEPQFVAATLAKALGMAPAAEASEPKAKSGRKAA
jgi:hypothetical protein